MAKNKRRGAFQFDSDGSEEGNVGLAGNCAVIHPYLKNDVLHHHRTPEARLEEGVRLARAIDLNVIESQTVALSSFRPSALFGSGKAEELGTHFRDMHVDVVIVDGTLSPVQQRNLEKVWKVKVIDRTGLILEIFGERARTREGRLQVELAHLTYQKSRLVRSWTHLERQRGGLGFVGGPGETQIEADRRIISERISKLQEQLETVKRTRDLHRESRKKVPYPIVALVGYTNAGKSTLFNRLTPAKVMAEDMLFATLDPTMREIQLESGQKIILSDTVGFISDLPTQLVAAFRATLEEVLSADLILHIRDISHPDTDAQRMDVETVLKDLGVDLEDQSHMIQVYNKIDALSENERTDVEAKAAEQSVLAISAAEGIGMQGLLRVIDGHFQQFKETVNCTLGFEEGKALAWIYNHGDVQERTDDDHGIHLTVSISPSDWGRFVKEYQSAISSFSEGS